MPFDQAPKRQNLGIREYQTGSKQTDAFTHAGLRNAVRTQRMPVLDLCVMRGQCKLCLRRRALVGGDHAAWKSNHVENIRSR